MPTETFFLLLFIFFGNGASKQEFFVPCVFVLSYSHITFRQAVK